MKRDTLYSESSEYLSRPDRDDPAAESAQTEVPKFMFDHSVAEVFDDMISRSVPLYQEVQQATAELAARFVQPNSIIYDAGCSTGTSLIAVSRSCQDTSARIIGIDSSEPMLNACRDRLSAAKLSNEIELRQADICEIEFPNASVIVCNYTLMFLPPEKRLAVLRAMFRGLRNGGVVLLSEKVRHDHQALQLALTDLHHAFKRRNGYSALEVARKREAIENVLIPLTADQNAQLLREAGFQTVEQYLKWYTFVSLAAVKTAN